MHISKLFAAIAVTGLVCHGTVEARAYRCTDAQGKVSYSQSPCPADQQSDRMRVGGGPRQDRDLCLLARNFAELVFTGLRQGMEPNEVIEEHGGVNYINPPTLSVINFAAGLRYNDQLTPRRVASLAFSRCSEGGFGKLQPGDLPEPEVEATAGLGGPGRSGSGVAGVGMPSSARVQERLGADCNGYREQLADLDERLRHKNSARENEALSVERARYRDALAAECGK